MSRRVVIVEPDASGRAVMERVLAAEGYAVDAVPTAADARPLLNAGAGVELLLMNDVDERGGVLAEVRALRREMPAVPMIVMGALLTPRVLRELLRLRVADALMKPFTPDDLREAVGRVVGRGAGRAEDALEYAAAIEAARRALSGGALDRARDALRRAHAVAPLDAEAMALSAVVAELRGDDDDADRGYRAALALRREEDTPAPDPHEGLARLAAYGDARPVVDLRPERRGGPARVVSDPMVELSGSAISTPHVVLLALGVGADDEGAIFFREGSGPRAFALMTGALRPSSVEQALQRLLAGAVIAEDGTHTTTTLRGESEA